MNRKRVTLAEVAAAAGVAASTASLVLSGRGQDLRISAASQQRVHDAAKKLGYRPNAISVGLRKGTTSTLGFISDSVASSQLAGEMIKGAIHAARDAGFMLFVGESGGSARQERLLIDAMVDRQVDGIILASMFTMEKPVPSELKQLPSVVLNFQPMEPTNIPVVLPDEYEAGRSAAKILLAAGRTKIHMLGVGTTLDMVPPASLAGFLRLKGILDVFEEQEVALLSGQMNVHWLPPEGYLMMGRILDSSQSVDAVICMNDRLAMGAYQALQEQGVSIPEEVSVVSFDDASIAAWLRPGLTTFSLPHRQMGRKAAEILISKIEGPRAPDSRAGTTPEVVLVSMPLRERESIA